MQLNGFPSCIWNRPLNTRPKRIPRTRQLLLQNLTMPLNRCPKPTALTHLVASLNDAQTHGLNPPPKHCPTPTYWHLIANLDGFKSLLHFKIGYHFKCWIKNERWCLQSNMYFSNMKLVKARLSNIMMNWTVYWSQTLRKKLLQVLKLIISSILLTTWNIIEHNSRYLALVDWLS